MIPDADKHELMERSGNRRTLARAQELFDAGVLTPFIGAGLSANFGFPLWDAMLLRIAEHVSLAKSKTFKRLFPDHLPEVAAYLRETADTNVFQRAFESIFNRPIRSNEPTHKALLSCWESRGPIVTTNYDQVIEHHASSMGIRFANGTTKGISGIETPDVVAAIDFREFALIKLHGDYRLGNGRVDTREAYAAAYNRRDGYLLNAFRKLLYSRSILFLGCGLRDETAEIMKRELNPRTQSVFEHFAVFTLRENGDAPERWRRQLERRGVTPIWIPHGRYDLIPTLISMLRNRECSQTGASMSLTLAIEHGDRSGDHDDGVSLDDVRNRLTAELEIGAHVPAPIVEGAFRNATYLRIRRSAEPLETWLARLERFARNARVRISATLGDQTCSRVLLNERIQIARDLLYLRHEDPSSSRKLGLLIAVCEGFSQYDEIKRRYHCEPAMAIPCPNDRFREYTGYSVFGTRCLRRDACEIQLGSEGVVDLLSPLRVAHPDFRRIHLENAVERDTTPERRRRKDKVSFAVSRESGDWRIQSWPRGRSDGERIRDNSSRSLRWNGLTIVAQATAGELVLTTSAEDLVKTDSAWSAWLGHGPQFKIVHNPRKT